MSKQGAILKDPTPTGGSPADVTGVDEESEKAPVSIAARDTVIDTIAARRREELEGPAEPEPKADDAPDSEPDPEAISELDPEPEPTPAPAAEEEPAPSVEMVTVKIDGVETSVPLSDVVAGYQKNGSADSRLNQAALVEKSLTERESDLQRREKEFNTKIRVPEVSVETSEDRRANVVALREAIYDGEEEALDAALDKVIPHAEQPTAPAVDEVALAAKVTNETLYRIDLGKAVERYEEEYPDLATNPRLRQWVDEETEVIQKEDPNLSAWDVLDKAAKSVQSQVDDMLKKKELGADLNKPERDEAKQKLADATPPAAPAAKATIGEDPAPPPSRQDVIKSMKEARGQTI